MPLGKKPLPTFTLENLKPPYPAYKYFTDNEERPLRVDSGAHAFRHAAKGFELINAWWLAEMATLVYSEPSFVRPRFEAAGVKHVETIDAGSGQCFVAVTNDFAVVAFRGTEIRKRVDDPDLRDVFADLLTDADALPVSFEAGGRVHKGFKKSIEAVWRGAGGVGGLQRYLAHLNDDGRARTLWFTGHSLCASLETLAAVMHDRVHGLYAYGSPRVGDEEFGRVFQRLFERRFGLQYYRFVHDHDIVTTVPPGGIYHHVGALKFITEGGDIRDNPSFWERLRQKWRSLFSMPFDNTGRLKPDFIRLVPEGLVDHAPQFYNVHIWNKYVEKLK